jgi:flagellar motor switch protein FliN/FliY
VPVDVTVELARKTVKVRDILNLEVDSVIPMDQSAGENVDLRLNGVAVGNGEIVVIEDMMGLRVTDLRSRLIDQG